MSFSKRRCDPCWPSTVIRATPLRPRRSRAIYCSTVALGCAERGENGAAVVPGKPEDSLLIKAVRYQDEPRMPPKNKLPAAVIADLEAWVKMGAPDPRDQANIATTMPWNEILRTRRDWWSLQPVRKPAARGARCRWVGPADRSLPSRPAGKGRVATRGTGRASNADSPPQPGAHRLAADAPKRWMRSSRDPSPNGLRTTRGPLAGLAALRRALGPALDGRRPLHRRRTATSGTTRSITPGAIATT